MYKIYISLSLLIFMFSCSTQRNMTTMNDGYYIGKIRKDLFFEYTVLVKLKGSAATVEAYLEEKGMATGYNIFSDKQTIPLSVYFQLNKEGGSYVLSDSLNKMIITPINGSFMIQSPLKMKLKYYKEDPTDLYPEKKYALYCYYWLNLDTILGIDKELNRPCQVYIQNKMDLNLKKIDTILTYENYYTMIKDSVSKYKQDFENNLKR